MAFSESKTSRVLTHPALSSIDSLSFASDLFEPLLGKWHTPVGDIMFISVRPQSPGGCSLPTSMQLTDRENLLVRMCGTAVLAAAVAHVQPW